jgi:hypothetical protein
VVKGLLQLLKVQVASTLQVVGSSSSSSRRIQMLSKALEHHTQMYTQIKLRDKTKDGNLLMFPVKEQIKCLVDKTKCHQHNLVLEISTHENPTSQA